MRPFDEVMIVNPYDPSIDGEGEQLMFGHYGWPGFGYYAAPYAYAEAPPMQPDSYGYADPSGYGDPYGYAAGYGYGDPYAYADPYYGYGYGDPYGYGYADPYGYGGYVAERPSRFNAGCPLPVNAGIGDDESIGGYEGYAPTADVNASCSGFRRGPASPDDVPDTFRPLW